MTQLRTPVMFSDRLGVLNEVRPFRLKSEISRELVLPVFDCPTPASSHIIKGRVGRCNPTGGQLRYGTELGFDNVEIESWSMTGTDFTVHSYTFDQVINYLVIVVTNLQGGEIRWCDDAGNELVDFDTVGVYPYRVRGQTFYLVKAVGINYEWGKLYGFF